MGAPQDSLKFTLATQNIEGGFSTTGSAVEVDGTVQATLTFANWYVRWLGIYLLFLDSGGIPVDPSGVEIKLPPDYDSPPGDREQLDQFAAMFALMLGPEFTVLGIPVASSKATVGFNLPPNTTTVRVFASGPALLLLGGVDPNDPTTWGDWFPGAACTLIINYGVTIVLMVAGACEDLSLIQKAALIVAPAIAKSLTALLSDELRDKDFSTPDVWRDVAVSIGKSLLQTLLNKRSAQLLALITCRRRRRGRRRLHSRRGTDRARHLACGGCGNAPRDHARDRGVAGLVRLRPDAGPRHHRDHPARLEQRPVPDGGDPLQGDGAVRPRRDAVHADASRCPPGR